MSPTGRKITTSLSNDARRSCSTDPARKRALRLPSIVALVALMTVLAAAAPKGGPRGGWQEDFNGPLAKRQWIVMDGVAPGSVTGQSIGYLEPANVEVVNGYLKIRVNQETGNVDGNPSGIVSHGGGIYTKAKYGYGTYEWRMRMSSTGADPNDPAGEAVSGSVSAGFIYVNNSQTEIDFEFAGHEPDSLFVTNWYNNDPATGPFESQGTTTQLPAFGLTTEFRTYKFVWAPGSISYYVDGVLQAVHTTNVPSAAAYLMIMHRGANNPYWGGTATLGVNRYAYVDWVKYTP